MVKENKVVDTNMLSCHSRASGPDLSVLLLQECFMAIAIATTKYENNVLRGVRLSPEATRCGERRTTWQSPCISKGLLRFARKTFIHGSDQ